MARHTIYFDEEMEKRCKYVFDVYDKRIISDMPSGLKLSTFLSILVYREYKKILKENENGQANKTNV